MAEISPRPQPTTSETIPSTMMATDLPLDGGAGWNPPYG